MTDPRYFVVYTRDAPDKASIRESNRPAHIAFMKSLAPYARVGGPLLAADGETRIGGMYVLEADSLQSAKDTAARDPYVQAGLFETIDVQEWRWQTRNI